MSEESLSPLGQRLQREVERMRGTDLTAFGKAVRAELEAQIAEDARLQENFARQLVGNDPTKLERLRNGDYKEAVAYCESISGGE